jgi:pSer/pThr/pTyr-binding forkhead associated (FHA) protein
MTAPTDPSTEVVLTVQLLDSAQNVPIQTWRFPVQPEIRVGRAPDNDVVITHPYVSRYHVRLLWRDGDWELVNMGTHGTLVQGRVTPRALLLDGDEVRLGPLGPTLRFNAHRSDSGMTPYGTMAGELPAAPTIEIDAVKKEEEVAAVADSDYFRQLQARLQALRERRQ